MFKSLLLIFFLPASCIHKKTSDQEGYRQEIISLLDKERKAHYAQDVGLFLSHFKDTVLFINKGKAEPFIRDRDFKIFADYFGSVDILKWEDRSAPQIFFSDDASLCYAIVQKQVIVKPKESGKLDTVNYAWLSVYRREGHQWKLECNISTNQ